MSLLAIADGMTAELGRLRFFGPVTHVYNPLEYARETFADYADRYGAQSKEVVLVGMNPGPWGMAQTGVPFGEVGMVRDWLKVRGAIGRPVDEHSKKRVQGFDCPRSEVSGTRLWGWARDRFGTPRQFFSRYFVANYCPLLFLSESGANVTPDKLSAQERMKLEAICDKALRRSIEALAPRHVVAVGQYAESCATRALTGLDVRIGRILHPSPASPAANKDWAGQATRQLIELGIHVP